MRSSRVQVFAGLGQQRRRAIRAFSTVVIEKTAHDSHLARQIDGRMTL